MIRLTLFNIWVQAFLFLFVQKESNFWDNYVWDLWNAEKTFASGQHLILCLITKDILILQRTWSGNALLVVCVSLVHAHCSNWRERDGVRHNLWNMSWVRFELMILWWNPVRGFLVIAVTWACTCSIRFICSVGLIAWDHFTVMILTWPVCFTFHPFAVLYSFTVFESQCLAFAFRRILVTCQEDPCHVTLCWHI